MPKGLWRRDSLLTTPLLKEHDNVEEVLIECGNGQ